MNIKYIIGCIIWFAGIFLCDVYAQEDVWRGKSVNFKHGKLQVSQNRRYLVHEDGTPFVYIGDTAWELFHRLNEEEVEEYLENRRAKGFTVIQAVILAEYGGLTVPDMNGNLPLINNNPDTPNESYFKWVDKVIRMAGKKGLYIGLLPTWGDKVNNKQWGIGPVIFNPDNAFRYGKWLGERYRNFKNIIWIHGGDRLGGGENFPVWDALGKGLRTSDKNHLITFHPQGECSSSQWFHTSEWLDFNMAQTGHSQMDYSIFEKIIVRDYQLVPVKPCIDGEPRYENHPICWKPEEYGWFDDVDVRQAMYWSLLSGAFGHTYGCHDIWQMLTPEREPISFARGGSWKKSMNLPGAFDLIHARRLMERFDWDSRTPDQSMIVSGNTSPKHKIVALRGEGFAWIYFPNGEKGQINFNKAGDVQRMKLSWLNPRTGEWSDAAPVGTSGIQTIIPPSSGRGNDWLLIAETR